MSSFALCICLPVCKCACACVCASAHTSPWGGVCVRVCTCLWQVPGSLTVVTATSAQGIPTRGLSRVGKRHSWVLVGVASSRVVQGVEVLDSYCRSAGGSPWQFLCDVPKPKGKVLQPLSADTVHVVRNFCSACRGPGVCRFSGGFHAHSNRHDDAAKAMSRMSDISAPPALLPLVCSSCTSTGQRRYRMLNHQRSVAC